MATDHGHGFAQMNTDKPQGNEPKPPTDHDELQKRIRQRREEIRQREGLLLDSANLIRLNTTRENLRDAVAMLVEAITL